jgi:hypothetical protein
MKKFQVTAEPGTHAGEPLAATATVSLGRRTVTVIGGDTGTQAAAGGAPRCHGPGSIHMSQLRDDQVMQPLDIFGGQKAGRRCQVTTSSRTQLEVHPN